MTKRARRQDSPPRPAAAEPAPGRLKTVFFWFVTVLLAALLLELVLIPYRSWNDWKYLQSGEHGWTNHLFERDDNTGTRLRAGAEGEEILYGSRIPVHIDAHGLRVTALPAAPANGLRILFIGDSFTFGAAEPAENTFAEIAASRAGGIARNGGVPGYGLAQMVAAASRDIPAEHPGIVVFQYSPWLVERAMSPLAPSYIGLVPAPYFAAGNTADAPMRLEKPLFAAKITDVPVMDYAAGPGTRGYASFLFRVGLPLYLHDDLAFLGMNVRVLSGLSPVPVTDPALLIRHAYREMDRVARDHGALPVILVLGSIAPFRVPATLFPPGIPVVDTQQSLLDALTEKSERGYARAWQHLAGEPPVVVDTHPNAAAHRLIGETLGAVLARMGNPAVIGHPTGSHATPTP